MSEAQKIDMALADMMAQLGVNARRAARQLTTASTDQKNTALQAAADECAPMPPIFSPPMARI